MPMSIALEQAKAALAATSSEVSSVPSVLSDTAKLREVLHDIGNACAWIADNDATDPTGQTQRYLRDIVCKVKSALATVG